MKKIFLQIFGWKYKNILKRFLFLFDAEFVHVVITRFGEFLGQYSFTRKLTWETFGYRNKRLRTNVNGIDFENPLGLSAGFDYEARLTQILPAVGFGFGTVGTITNSEYGGNSRPMLGRLVKSRALLVNKGFKNFGAVKTIARLKKTKFYYPVGISIGRTNTINLKTQKESVEDIVTTFKLFEKSGLNHAYYELNISCPNLMGDISFYPPKNLEELLVAVDKLKIKKPVWIKMPIEKSNEEVLEMLAVIVKHRIEAVIFGNLQKNRNDPELVQEEVVKQGKGHFSGKPTEKRSNELIELAYKNYGDKLKIVGCGGVFSTEDAWEKLRLGASLVQLITGMIFEGPQIIGEINRGLVELMKKNGYEKIEEVVGTKYEK